MEHELTRHLEDNYPEVRTHKRLVEEIPNGYRVTYLPKLSRREKLRIGVTALTLAYIVLAPVACTMSRGSARVSQPSSVENTNR